MTAAELKALLESYGISPLRARGQHFLLDDAVVRRMCDAAAVGDGSNELEIGPGPGILTAELLRRGANVVAVELDLKLQRLQRDRFGATARFRLVSGDALDLPNSDIERFFGGKPYDVVANLPYNITSAAFEKFLLGEWGPRSLTVMVQREVADRVMASPSAMNRLALLVRAYGEPSYVAAVPAGAFFPPPKVDSAVLRVALAPHEEIERRFSAAGGAGKVLSLAAAAFASPRKQIASTLSHLFPSPAVFEDVCRAAGVGRSARPAELVLEKWITLAEIRKKFMDAR